MIRCMGSRKGDFFHGYYKRYCYLPLYIFCGEHLLCARLRSSDRGAAHGGGAGTEGDREAAAGGVAPGADHGGAETAIFPRMS